MERNSYSLTIIRNVSALLEKRGWTPYRFNKMLDQKYGRERAYDIYDFLKGRKSDSIRVSTLGIYADMLDVPIEAFFARPGKLDETIEMQRTLDRIEPAQLAHALAIVRTFVEAACSAPPPPEDPPDTQSDELPHQ